MLTPLTMLIVSDFRTREVSVIWLCVLAVGTIGIPIILDGWAEVLRRSGQNLLILMDMSVGIVLWGWVKARKPVSPINRYIGLGDVLFFLALVPLFPVRQYIWLLMGCFVFSLVWWGAATLWFKRSPRNIPFIATSGIVVVVAIILKVFFE
jgi:hypothetical protein